MDATNLRTVGITCLSQAERDRFAAGEVKAMFDDER